MRDLVIHIIFDITLICAMALMVLDLFNIIDMTGERAIILIIMGAILVACIVGG